VKFWSNETRSATLNGFTIENGIGAASIVIEYSRHAGGISIGNASPSVLNCVIQNNHVPTGYAGGLTVASSSNMPAILFLSGTVIKNNTSKEGGGGIMLNERASVIFDPINKNSIFNNMSGLGHDIFSLSRSMYIDIILDTFTVAMDHYNHIVMGFDYGLQFDHHKINFINADLYVCITGDDVNNDGLSQATPFKSIAHAMYMIASDPDHPKTIYIAPGRYRASEQYFPIQMKSHVILKGAGPEYTFFDGENGWGFITSTKGAEHFKITGISFENVGYRGIYYITSSLYLSGIHGVEISNCHFRNNHQAIRSLLMHSRPWDWSLNSESEAVFRDLVFDGNKNDVIYVYMFKGTFENITVMNNQRFFDWNDNHWGGHTPIIIADGVGYRSSHTFSNLLMYNNEVYVGPDWSQFRPNGLGIGHSSDVIINNATFVGNFANQGVQGGPFFVDRNSNVRIYNSIFYNNQPNNLWMMGSQNRVSNLYVNNILLPGGASAVRGQGPFSILHWGTGNIDANPMFCEDSEHPYQLSEISPAIDAGTLNIEGYVWPETDILGNPRIVGASVDLGAYEFQGLYANFIADIVSGDVPLTVQFNCGSSGAVWSWEWDFDNDGTIDSFERNPIWTYTMPGTYSVRLRINQGEKQVIKRDFIEVIDPTGDFDIFDIPLIMSLSEPFPNPFRGRTEFRTAINADGRVRMTVYNVRGQRVRGIVDAEKIVGIYNVVWDGRDDRGNPVASGIYTIELRHENKRVGVVRVSYIR
jgi:hypothetical protein